MSHYFIGLYPENPETVFILCSVYTGFYYVQRLISTQTA